MLNEPNGSDETTTEHARAGDENLPLAADQQFSEQRARDFVAACREAGQQTPSIRALAEHWGWHRSRVERLLSRIKTETAVETVSETVLSVLPQPEPATTKEDDFDWFDRDSVIIREQPAIACYWNPHGEVIIRRRADWCEDEDHFIYVRVEYLDALIERLKNMRDSARREGQR
jgi:hypothetical protein